MAKNKIIAIVCFILSLAILNNAQSPTEIKAKVAEALIRAKPDLQGEILFRLRPGSVLSVQNKAGEFYEVTYKSQLGFSIVGYIHESEVEVTTESSSSNTTKTNQDIPPSKTQEPIVSEDQLKNNANIDSPPTTREAKPSSISPPEITLESLERTRSVMPEKDFNEIWGEMYKRLLEAQKENMMTSMTDAELGERARLELDEIHKYLKDPMASSPSSDNLCRWIVFCLDLKLEKEAARLFSMLDRDAVKPEILEWLIRLKSSSRSTKIRK